MNSTETVSYRRVYFAPMQGHTDYVYRKVFSQKIGHVDKYFIPYITWEKDKSIRKSRLKEIAPAHNNFCNAVPQILAGSIEEMKALLKIIEDDGFTHVNLNLGCPFSMVVKRGKGCALLQFPERIKNLLETAFENKNLKVSIKTRTGLFRHEEFLNLIPVLNAFPLEEIIIHPRLGQQQYKGSADISVFLEYKKLLTHAVVYNGDIDTSNFENILNHELKDVSTLMIGRGFLRDPMLIFKLKNIPTEDQNKTMQNFIWALMEEYTRVLEHETHILNKLQEHFEYLGDWFPSELKIKKRVKKARSLAEIKEALRLYFQ